MNEEKGFTLIEVAIAAVIMTVGLVFLASLFTLAIAQNRFVKQSTTTTMLAQQKLEELIALERLDSTGKPDARLTIGGELNDSKKAQGYYDNVYVDDKGKVTTTAPAGDTPTYHRYWKIESDPQLSQAVIISVRVVAAQASRGRTAEESTLTTIRAW